MPDFKPFHEVISERLFSDIETFDKTPVIKVVRITTCLGFLSDSEMPVEAAHRIGNALREKSVEESLANSPYENLPFLVGKTIVNLLSRT